MRRRPIIRKVSWKEYDQLVRKVTLQITKDAAEHIAVSELKSVFGFPRGGTVVAVSFSHRLGLKYNPNKGIGSIRTLYVDDICDSGQTFKQSLCAPESLITVALFKKKHSTFKPSYVGEVVNNNVWLLMPWENQHIDTVLKDRATYIQSRREKK